MGSKSRKDAKKSGKGSKAKKDLARSVRDSALGFLEEAEKTSEALVEEVKQLFDSLTHKMTSVAGSAAETTASVTEKVVSKESFSGLIEDVTEAGEASMRAIGESFDTLRQQVLSTAEAIRSKTTPEKKKSADKGKAKKKVTAKKAAKKKTVAKKAAAKKKSTTKKRASSKKS